MNTFSNKKNLREKNDEIEQKVLSILLNDENVALEVISTINIDDFLNEVNRIIYKEIINLFNLERKIDPTILLSRLKQYDNDYKEPLKIVLFRIINLYVNSLDLEKYLVNLKKNAIAYKINDFGDNISEKIFDFDNFDEELWTIQKELQAIINSLNQNSGLLTLDELGEEYNSALEKIRLQNNSLSGTTSGFSSIDEFTNGFQAGDLIILAARPSMGKTALALNFLLNAAKSCEPDECVVMFSLEMSARQLMERIICIESGLNSYSLKKGTWSDEDQRLINDCIEKVRTLPIIIDESSNASILDIQSKLKKISTTKKIKLVVVDYLQLVQGSNKIGINRQQEVAQISRALKAIAKDLSTPLIAVAQLSRKIEERKGPDKKPILSDLRESGSIEQDADLVTFLDYDRQEVDDSNSNNFIKKYESTMIVDFIIAKHRNGATGEIKLGFEKTSGRYCCYEE